MFADKQTLLSTELDEVGESVETWSYELYVNKSKFVCAKISTNKGSKILK